MKLFDLEAKQADDEEEEEEDEDIENSDDSEETESDDEETGDRFEGKKLCVYHYVSKYEI